MEMGFNQQRIRAETHALWQVTEHLVRSARTLLLAKQVEQVTIEER